MKAVLALILCLCAGQAMALSCLRPDPIETFQRVAASDNAYYVLFGQLSFDEALLPVGVVNGVERDPAAIPARFVGKGLTKQGFTSDYITSALLQPTCAGPWCGSARSDVDAVYFVRADNSPVVMEANPCGGMIFEAPMQDVLDALTACMQGGVCSPQPLQ